MGFHQPASREYMRSFAEHGGSSALSERDRAFGDYREARLDAGAASDHG